MNDFLAYIDESGNASLSLEKEGTSTHYIVLAVVCSGADRPSLLTGFEKIRKRYFQTGEMKSSSVGADDNRRSIILTNLQQLNFKCIALVVDKRALSSKGYEYKRSFIKNLQGRLYSRLFTSFPDIQVYADEHGSTEFMAGFIKYIESRHQPTLFQKSKVTFVSSKSEGLIQLADFLAGTISRSFDQKYLRDPTKSYIHKLLESRHLLSVMEFPPERKTYKEFELELPDEFDGLIAQVAYDQVLLYLEHADGSEDSIVRQQVAALELLMLEFRYGQKTGFVSSDRVINHIEEATGVPISLRRFRSDIVGRLRDAGLLIASSQKGLRIPKTVKHLEQYLQHQQAILGPTISRVKRARDRIYERTLGELDILENSNFELLKRVVKIELVQSSEKVTKESG